MIEQTLAWLAPILWWIILAMVALSGLASVITVLLWIPPNSNVRAEAATRLGGLAVVFAALVAALAYWTPLALPQN